MSRTAESEALQDDVEDLEETVHGAIRVIEFLYGCLTDDHFVYQYPKMTLRNVREWRRALTELAVDLPGEPRLQERASQLRSTITEAIALVMTLHRHLVKPLARTRPDPDRVAAAWRAWKELAPPPTPHCAHLFYHGEICEACREKRARWQRRADRASRRARRQAARKP